MAIDRATITIKIAPKIFDFLSIVCDFTILIVHRPMTIYIKLAEIGRNIWDSSKLFKRQICNGPYNFPAIFFAAYASHFPQFIAFNRRVIHGYFLALLDVSDSKESQSAHPRTRSTRMV